MMCTMKNRYTQKNNIVTSKKRGYTLLELLTVMIIMCCITGIIYVQREKNVVKVLEKQAYTEMLGIGREIQEKMQDGDWVSTHIRLNSINNGVDYSGYVCAVEYGYNNVSNTLDLGTYMASNSVKETAYNYLSSALVGEWELEFKSEITYDIPFRTINNDPWNEKYEIYGIALNDNNSTRDSILICCGGADRKIDGKDDLYCLVEKIDSKIKIVTNGFGNNDIGKILVGDGKLNCSLDDCNTEYSAISADNCEIKNGKSYIKDISMMRAAI